MSLLQYQTATLADRSAFISKVYTMLGISLLFGCAGAYFGLSMPLSLYFPVIIAEFIAVLACSFLHRSYPLNIMLLFAFATLSGLTIGPVLTYYILHGQGQIVPTAFGVTSLTFGGLSLYAHTSKRDFSMMGGMLTMALIALIVVGFVSMFIHLPILQAIYAWGGAVVFSGFILFDTSMMIRRYADDQYVAATLALYLDFINLFMAVLRILGGGRRN